MVGDKKAKGTKSKKHKKPGQGVQKGSNRKSNKKKNGPTLAIKVLVIPFTKEKEKRKIIKEFENKAAIETLGKAVIVSILSKQRDGVVENFEGY